MIGAVGTPTSKASQPIATDAKVPFIGPFTGAEFLRNPYNRYVVNVRASYFEETEAWIEHLTKDLGITKIAILYQDDAFGLAGLEGVQRAHGEAQYAARRLRQLQAQHHGGEIGAARHHEGQSGSRGHGRALQAGRRIHQARAPGQNEPGVRRDLLRRLGFAGERARQRRRRRHRQPGRAVRRGRRRCRWWRPINRR